MGAPQFHPVQTRPAGWLQPALYNPRRMGPAELEQLVESIRRFGFAEPLVARAEHGLLLGGHQRLRALLLLAERQGTVPAAGPGAVEVPVVVVSGLSDSDAKLLNLALNKIHGEWDYEKLSGLLADLRARLPSADIGVSGFSLAEVDDIVAVMSAGLAGAASASSESGDPGGELVADVATDTEAVFCAETLRLYGMAGPSGAAKALLSAGRAVQAP